MKVMAKGLKGPYHSYPVLLISKGKEKLEQVETYMHSQLYG
jgi:hypothetical protein